MSEIDTFRDLDARTRAWSEGLRADRCRPLKRFEKHELQQRVRVLAPITGRWTSELIFVLYMRGPSRFGELRAELEGITARVLTDKLRQLARAGIVEHDPDAPLHYQLTSTGELVARHLHTIVFSFNHGAVIAR